MHEPEKVKGVGEDGCNGRKRKVARAVRGETGIKESRKPGCCKLNHYDYLRDQID